MTTRPKSPWRDRTSKARAATVAAVVARLTRDLGREPSDAETARLLVTSKHVARAQVGMVRP